MKTRAKVRIRNPKLLNPKGKQQRQALKTLATKQKSTGVKLNKAEATQVNTE